MTLLFFDSAPEIIFILVVALIIFGPRKLPELSRSLGKSLGEFKRASDDFKRTWEREVSLEHVERERKIGEAMLPPEEARALTPAEGNMISSHVVAVDSDEGTHTVARGADASTQGESHAQAFDTTTATNADASADVQPAPQSPHKTDWL